MRDRHMEMTPINYGTSFITGLWEVNRVRFWVESRVRIIDAERGTVEDYYQVGSCKGEDTFAKDNLFRPDNFDFLPVFGPEYGIIFVRRVHLHDRYKEVRKAAEMWQGQRYSIREHGTVRLLETNEQIRAATHDLVLLVGQTELSSPDGGLRAIIEFPVKTMNIDDPRDLYQVDTGPVMLPDLSRRYERAVDAMRPAYLAFNVPHFTDFVVETVTPIMVDGVQAAQTYHFSEMITLPAANRLYGVAD